MTAWSCWTLPGFSRKSIFEFDSYPKMVEHFWSHHGAARSETMGAFIECDTCSMRTNNTCNGGCLARPIRLMNSEQSGLRDVAFTVPVTIEEVGDE
jgi:radical SAM protein with 4Fe4S-binding SPASM domain